MIKGIVIPANEDQPITVLDYEQSDIDAIQNVVGGYFEAVEAPDADLTFWINEEGKFISVPPNRRATSLLWAVNPAWINHDILMGDVLLSGGADAHGNTKSVPADILQMMFDSRKFRVEFKLPDITNWVTCSQRHFDYWEALLHGAQVAQQWKPVRSFRIKAA